MMFIQLAKINLLRKGGLLKKKKGDDKIIVTVALCVVATILAVLFKDSIVPIMSGLLTKVQEAITGMFN
jgi:hypothetical protein